MKSPTSLNFLNQSQIFCKGLQCIFATIVADIERAVKYQAMSFTMTLHIQGRSSTEIVGGGGGGVRFGKSVGHHGWPTEKILVFEWRKMAQMTLNFFVFSGTFLNLFRIFLFRRNMFCEPFSFYRCFFIKIQKIKKNPDLV